MFSQVLSPTIQCLVKLLDDDSTQVRLHGIRKLTQLGSISRPAAAALGDAIRERKVHQAAAFDRRRDCQDW